ncbi:nuclear transport factor 2 family protein [Kribbella sp. HUAS MG21]|uniref:Nuclear transport factor 2 family protein n=1 Tax=Kribbella sp. HUAS MG21 TaxID=3160966 RepID=A0AAU7TG83_9ACTN
MDLPDTIIKYLAAHTARDVGTAIQTYADDAVVTDDGRTYRGRDEIRAWLSDAASEYTYTTELTGSRKLDDSTYVVTQHLEGDFPGGTADLDFTFDLDQDLITRLVIAAQP